MKNFLRRMRAFLIAVIATALLASIFGTQIVLADLGRFGLSVSFSDRLSTTIQDIGGLALVLPLLVSVTFLVAFSVAALGNRFVGGNRGVWFLLAGLSSLPASLILIKSMMGGTLFAAARTNTGMLAMALCGGMGAWLYVRLTQKERV